MNLTKAQIGDIRLYNKTVLRIRKNKRDRELAANTLKLIDEHAQFSAAAREDERVS